MNGKRFCALFLTLALLMALTVPAAAARDLSTAESQADVLYSMGLFKGTGLKDDGTPNYALDRAPTRAETLILMLRLLGREQDALTGKYTHPFTDVSDTVSPYVGYAYQHGLTNGLSATRFGSQQTAAGYTYLTFVLRALGYSDKNGADFTAASPFALAKSVGLLPSGVDTDSFLRADVVLVSYAALRATLKGSTTTLLQSLVGEGAVSQAAARASGLLPAGTDAFALGQDDNFANCGLSCWDDAGTYFICNDKSTSSTVLPAAARVLRQETDGSMTELYQAESTAATLSKLSAHDGKLYFLENTMDGTSAVSRYFRLMELDPATGRSTRLFRSDYAIQTYCYCSGSFYVFYQEDAAFDGSEHYTFARVRSGQAEPLLSGMSSASAEDFHAYGWNDMLYLVSYAKNEDGKLQRRLWTLDPVTGAQDPVDLHGSLINCFFSGDDLYYFSYTYANGTSSAPVLYHLSLSAPQAAPRSIGTFPGFGPLYQHHGTFYCMASDYSAKALWTMDQTGSVTTALSPVWSAPAAFFGGRVLVARGSAYSAITVYDLATGVSTPYADFLGLGA